MYAIEMCKPEYDCLVKHAGMPKEGKLSKYGWNCGGLRPAFVLPNEHTAIIAFRTMRDAYEFGMWAAGWIAKAYDLERVPIINYIGKI